MIRFSQSIAIKNESIQGRVQVLWQLACSLIAQAGCDAWAQPYYLSSHRMLIYSNLIPSFSGQWFWCWRIASWFAELSSDPSTFSLRTSLILMLIWTVNKPLTVPLNERMLLFLDTFIQFFTFLYGRIDYMHIISILNHANPVPRHPVHISLHRLHFGPVGRKTGKSIRR